MKDNGGCFINAFLIFGLIALALALTYRFGFYARYLDLENNEVVFDWTGGEQDVWVYTDANSWVIEDEEYISWATFQNWGGKLHIYAYPNNNKENRSSQVMIRSGFIEGIGNERYWLNVVQKGKQASYLNVSRQTVSFSERGGSESLQISTDGDSWYVTDCPSWITKSVSGNTLVLIAATNHGMSRIGSVHLQSGEEVTGIEVTQYGKSVFTVNGVSFVMKFVEGGTYTMGSNNSEWDDERPAHEVTVSSFYMSETEVTKALWKAVMGNRVPSHIYREYFLHCDNNLPIEVDWDECWDFIHKLNKLTGMVFRLPTEAEWEYAAKGGKKSRGYKYAGSNNMDDVAWFFYEGDHPVKQKRPNELGLYDMSGNVLEYCSDLYGPYSSSSQINPQGPLSGYGHVLRGGTGVMESGPEDCQVTNRCAGSPGGIRLCLQQ